MYFLRYVDPVTVAKTPKEPSRQIVFPPVTDEEINHACQNSINKAEKKEQFAINLVR